MDAQVRERIRKTSITTAWCAYFLALVCFYALMLGGVYKQFSELAYHNDFVTFYASANLVKNRDAEHLNVYNPKQFGEYVLRYMPETKEPIGYFMAYPPFFMGMLLPLSLLSLQNAYLVYTVLSLVSAVVAIRLASSGMLNKHQTLIAGLLTMSSSPAWYNFSGGQTAGFLLLAYTAVYVLLRNQKPTQAGLATGLALMKLQFVPILGLSGLVLGRGRYFLSAFVLAAFLMVWGCFVVGWENMASFPSSLLGNENQEVRIKSSIEANLRAVLLAVPGVTADNATPIAAVIFALVAIACGLIWWKVFPKLRDRTPRAFELCASLTTMSAVMLSIHANSYDYLMLALPFIWLWQWSKELDQMKTNANNGRLRQMLRIAIIIFIIVTQPPISFSILGTRGWSVCFFSALIILILAGVETVKLLRSDKAA